MDVRLPQLAEGADSGSVVNVLAAVGDKVAKDQTVLELENQKAVAPIGSPSEGTITQIHVKAGDVVSVGQLLFSLSEGAAQPAAAPAQQQQQQPKDAGKSAPQQQQQQTSTAPAGPRSAEAAGLPAPASPSLRKMARELGLDLARVQGSGRGGRITVEDVRNYIQQLQKGGGQASSQPAQPAAPKIDFAKWGPVSKKPFTPMRQAIAKAMVSSWTHVPHVALFDDADITGILDLIKKHGPSYEKDGIKLTVTGFVIRALSEVLKKHPVMNSSLDEAAREIVLKQYVHIGIAVDTEAGLIVPVLRDAGKKKMLEVAKGLQELAEKARSKKLPPEDLQGGSFTISNQGGIGGKHFTPIIHQPEVAILGLGRAKLQAVYKTAESPAQPRWMMPVAVSFDHRVLDGADAARFLKDLVQALETFPETEVKR